MVSSSLPRGERTKGNNSSDGLVAGLVDETEDEEDVHYLNGDVELVEEEEEEEDEVDYSKESIGNDKEKEEEGLEAGEDIHGDVEGDGDGDGEGEDIDGEGHAEEGETQGKGKDKGEGKNFGATRVATDLIAGCPVVEAVSVPTIWFRYTVGGKPTTQGKKVVTSLPTTFMPIRFPIVTNDEAVLQYKVRAYARSNLSHSIV